MRKLASIQEVKDVRPIENADKIEVIDVLGWHVVYKKDGLKAGDRCVYIEIDSILPEGVPEFAFMSSSKYRVQTKRFRGQVSQGLAFPVNELLGSFPDLDKQKIGTDVTEYLGITKKEDQVPDETPADKVINLHYILKKLPLMRYRWYRELLKLIFGTTSGEFPSHIVGKTDEERIQNIDSPFVTYKDKLFRITEKLEGQSATYVLTARLFASKFTVCSRNRAIPRPDNSTFWRIAQKSNLKKIMMSLPLSVGESISLQGEIIGPKIQNNIYGLKDLEFRVFNALRVSKTGERTYMEPEDVELMGLKFVPILHEGVTIDAYSGEDLDKLIASADGESKLAEGVKREGVVYRGMDWSKGFKIVSNDYLLT